MMYLKNLNTDIVAIAKLGTKAKELKKGDRNTVADQLAYIDANQEQDRLEFSLFYWKVFMFIIAIITILSINSAQPILFFGRWGLNILTGILSGAAIGYVVIWGIQKLGIKV